MMERATERMSWSLSLRHRGAGKTLKPTGNNAREAGHIRQFIIGIVSAQRNTQVISTTSEYLR